MSRTTPRSADASDRDGAPGTEPGPGPGSEPVEKLAQLRLAPGHLLRRGRQLHDALWLELIGTEPTPLQFAALTALDEEPGLNQRELGDRIALDKSTLGDIVSRLARHGYVTRQLDPRDRRSRVITITPAGRRALERTRPAVVQIGRAMLGSLEHEERVQLIRLLSKLVFSDFAIETAGRRRGANGVPPAHDASTQELRV